MEFPPSSWDNLGKTPLEDTHRKFHQYKKCVSPVPATSKHSLWKETGNILDCMPLLTMPGRKGNIRQATKDAHEESSNSWQVYLLSHKNLVHRNLNLQVSLRLCKLLKELQEVEEHQSKLQGIYALSTDGCRECCKFRQPGTLWSSTLGPWTRSQEIQVAIQQGNKAKEPNSISNEDFLPCIRSDSDREASDTNKDRTWARVTATMQKKINPSWRWDSNSSKLSLCLAGTGSFCTCSHTPQAQIEPQLNTTLPGAQNETQHQSKTFHSSDTANKYIQ